VTDHPERLDLQLQRARVRRDRLRFGVPLGLLSGVGAVCWFWQINGWHWWYVLAVGAALAVGLWLSRLEDDVIEEVTRRCWRSPS
jgi:hypothetical protein